MSSSVSSLSENVDDDDHLFALWQKAFAGCPQLIHMHPNLHPQHHAVDGTWPWPVEQGEVAVYVPVNAKISSATFAHIVFQRVHQLSCSSRPPDTAPQNFDVEAM